MKHFRVSYLGCVVTGERIKTNSKKSFLNYMTIINWRYYPILALVNTPELALPLLYCDGKNICFKPSFPQICITKQPQHAF